MRHRIVAAAALLFAPAVPAATPWPAFLDVDLAYRNSAPLEPGQRWDVRLGLGAESEPTFQGSDTNESEVAPFLLAAFRDHWGNVFLAGDGLGYSRLLHDDVGILLRLEAEDARSESDDDRLEGLGDQDEETELEIVAKYFAGPWQLGASLALATGDKGTVWFLGAGYTWRPRGERLFVTLNADLSGSDQDNQQTDFGITAEQSAASAEGFPVFEPDGGLKSFGVRLAADYRLGGRWLAFGEVDYERLLGDVADSPLVEQGGSADNFEVGLGVYYRF